MSTALSAEDLDTADWRSSSYSGSGGGACIQPALNFAETHGVVPVRDSKDPQGPALHFTVEAFATFAQWAATFEV